MYRGGQEEQVYSTERPGSRDFSRNRVAALVSLAGFGVLVATVGAGIWKWSNPEPVVMVLGPVACIVGTVAGAFIGFQVGIAGLEQSEAARQDAERARQEAETVALTLAASGDPGEAIRIVRALRPSTVETTQTAG
jgi:hypothetical protein